MREKWDKAHHGFNSTLVQLEADAGPVWWNTPATFQFHTGSIRRDLYIVKSAVSFVFQFHTGSIKGGIERVGVEYKRIVSIPHWFN